MAIVVYSVILFLKVYMCECVCIYVCVCVGGGCACICVCGVWVCVFPCVRRRARVHACERGVCGSAVGYLGLGRTRISWIDTGNKNSF